MMENVPLISRIGTDADDRSIDSDIFIYLAHLHFSEAELIEWCNRMLVECDWPSFPSQISIIVADDFLLDPNTNPRVTFLHAANAASRFRQRCSEIEAAPHDILVCFGLFFPSSDVIGKLRKKLRDEDMVSAVVPRIAIEPEGHLVSLEDHHNAGDPELIDRRQCSSLPSVYYLPEKLFPCICIHEKMIGNIIPTDEFRHFPDLILSFLRAARRRGFLLLVDNRSIMPVSTYSFDEQEILKETAKMKRLFEDYQPTKARLAQYPALAAERRMNVSSAIRERSGPTLLLDCTTLAEHYNGTAHCAIGIVKGITRIEGHAWQVSVMIRDDSRPYFRFDKQFPSIEFVSPSDPRQYDVAIRLGQAWSISTFLDLSRRARSIAIMILDVIGPDVIYPVPAGSEEAFQFAGEHADGLIYISQFSQRQFRRRFFTRPGLVEAVIHLSLDPADYRSARDLVASKDSWILVFGNAYEHKDLPRTIDTIATAFPVEQIKVVGIAGLKYSNVECFVSGDLDRYNLDSLIQNAKFVVFPSFYEGFGFPIIEGLSHGKTVVARESKLLREIAAVSPKIGRLVGYENSLELLPIIATLLCGEDWPSIPLGTDPHAGENCGWSACAAHVFEFADRLLASEDCYRLQQRDRALRYMWVPH